MCLSCFIFHGCLRYLQRILLCGCLLALLVCDVTALASVGYEGCEQRCEDKYDRCMRY